MADVQTIAVTYTGKETPFIDRIYRSRLTFEPGQTRALPAALAAKFLRHADVFQAARDADESEQTDEPGKDDKVDDTAGQLDAAARAEAERRAQEDARFELRQQIDKMDGKALRDWAKVKFGQEFAPNLGVGKLRERVQELVDQFGAP